jgi:hypothetical protein
MNVEIPIKIGTTAIHTIELTDCKKIKSEKKVH